MSSEHEHNILITDNIPACSCGKTLSELYQETAEQLAQAREENATMRALLEKLAHANPGDADGPNDDMSCRYCGGWPDWDSIPKGTKRDSYTYQHELDCWWLKACTFLSEHPQS